MTIKLSDIQAPNSTYEISLVKLIGRPIADVRGYITDPYGNGPLFKLTHIEFADGTLLEVEGEHDMPYCGSDHRQPNFDEETLERLYREDNPENEDEE